MELCNKSYGEIPKGRYKLNLEKTLPSDQIAILPHVREIKSSNIQPSSPFQTQQMRREITKKKERMRERERKDVEREGKGERESGALEPRTSSSPPQNKVRICI